MSSDASSPPPSPESPLSTAPPSSSVDDSLTSAASRLSAMLPLMNGDSRLTADMTADLLSATDDVNLREQLYNDLAKTAPGQMYTPTLWVAFIVPFTIALMALKLKLLTINGASAALMVGFVILAEGGNIPAAMLIFFFLLGSAATKYKQKAKAKAMPYDEHAGAEDSKASSSPSSPTSTSTSPPAPVRKGRDMYQVFATGLLPAIICLTRRFIPIFPHARPALWHFLVDTSLYERDWWYIAYLAYVSCSCADTLASEIGMLAKQKPIFIWDFKNGAKRTPKGMDGSMTFLGTVASLIGGLLIGVCAFTGQDIYYGLIYGGIGSLIDSALGAVIQSKQYINNNHESNSKYSIDVDGFAELKMQPNLTLNSFQWKKWNNLVNFISATLCSILALITQYIHVYYHHDLSPLYLFINVLLCCALLPTRSNVSIFFSVVAVCLWSFWFSEAYIIVCIGIALEGMFVVWRMAPAQAQSNSHKRK